MDNYLGNKLRKRKIDLALKELKLENFYLDVYVLSQSLVKDANIEKIQNLVLFLEQYFILQYNPEYNVLKVAGSSACRIHWEETLFFLRKAA